MNSLPTTTTANTEEVGVDEEDYDSSDSDDFLYSDDSESLSDAYFHPQNEEKSSYGTLESIKNSPSRKHYTQQQPSISEDSPISPSSALLASPSSTTLNGNSIRKQNQRYKKQRRRHLRRQLRQQRERDVELIRGKPQSPNKCHDAFWSILFLLQLFLVFISSMRYGWTLLQPNSTFSLDDNPLNASVGTDFGTRRGRLLQLSVVESNHSNFNTKGQGVKTFNVTSETTPKGVQNLQDDDNLFGQSQNSVHSTSTSTAEADFDKIKDVLNDPNGTFSFRIDYQTVITIVVIAGFYACVTSYLSFCFMLSVARSIIPIVLIATIILGFCWALFGLTVFPHSSISILGFCFLALAMGYAIIAWNRIPFCSINLYTAMSALRDTRGIMFIGVGSLGITFLWLLVWLLALIGLFNTSHSRECQKSQIDCKTHLVLETDRYVELLGLIFSFFWTGIVIRNLVRTTVAGASGGWWYSRPSETYTCLNSIVWDHLIRSCSTSLGSICLASILEFPIQIISMVGCCLRDNKKRIVQISGREEVAETSFLYRKIRRCNRWALVYVGMYGYSFSNGGEKTYQLFKTRGWLSIAEENLIENILLMASIAIGGICGVFALLVEESDGYTFTTLHQPILTSFWLGAITGFVLSNILLLGVVASAVNTVLICFAADPFEFEKNHPRLSLEMRGVWSELVWDPNADDHAIQ